MFSKGSNAKKPNETNFDCNHNKCGAFVLKSRYSYNKNTHTYTNNRPSPCFLYEVLLINYARAGVRRFSRAIFEMSEHLAQKHENQVQNHD